MFTAKLIELRVFRLEVLLNIVKSAGCACLLSVGRRIMCMSATKGENVCSPVIPFVLLEMHNRTGTIAGSIRDHVLVYLQS